MPSSLALSSSVSDSAPKVAAFTKEDFLTRLFQQYRPRLAYDMLDKGTSQQKTWGYDWVLWRWWLVQSFTFKELRGLRVVVIPKSYGVDLITDLGAYEVTRWVVHKDKVS